MTYDASSTWFESSHGLGLVGAPCLPVAHRPAGAALARGPSSPEVRSWGIVDKSRLREIARMQGILGVSLSDYSRMLRLSPDDLLDWTEAPLHVNAVGPDPKRFERMKGLVDEWAKRSPAPLDAVLAAPLGSAAGHCLMDLLTSDSFDDEAILGAFDELASRLLHRPRTLSERLAADGVKPRQSAWSLPREE